MPKLAKRANRYGRTEGRRTQRFKNGSTFKTCIVSFLPTKNINIFFLFIITTKSILKWIIFLHKNY